MRPIKVVTSSAREDRRVEKREYKHFEVPRTWYSLPSLLLFNATSLANKMDEVIVTVRSTCADTVAVTEAWQIVPEVCTMQDYQLYHHLRSGRRGGEWPFSAAMSSAPHTSLSIFLPVWRPCG